jgi:Family of unknown function (DUF6069)
MTATVTTATVPTSSAVHADRRVGVRAVAGAGVLAAAAAAAAVYVYGSIAQSLHGPMHAGDPGASHAVPLHPSSFSVGVLFCVALGTVIAAVIARRSPVPARTFLRTALALTALSLGPALLASHTDEATRLILCGAHILAAGIAIPVITRRLSR